MLKKLIQDINLSVKVDVAKSIVRFLPKTILSFFKYPSMTVIILLILYFFCLPMSKERVSSYKSNIGTISTGSVSITTGTSSLGA